jgi:hypothetical protein
MLVEFAAVRDDLLGDEDSVTPERPVLVDGVLVGGTALERSGIQGIKDTRCYTNTLSHQHPRDLVGITASAKIYDGKLTEMQKTRKRMAAVSSISCLCLIKLKLYVAWSCSNYAIHGGMRPKRLPSSS